MSKIMLNNVSVQDLSLLYKYSGVGFHIQSGEITGAFIEGDETQTDCNISPESVFVLLREVRDDLNPAITA